MAAEIERVAKKLKQGLLLRRSSELGHIIELAGKIEKAARIGMADVEVLEKVIDEGHGAIDQLEPEIGRAPAGSPRTRLEWVRKQVSRVILSLARERDRTQDAIDRLATQLKWKIPPGSPHDRIDWVTAQVRELQVRR